MISKRGVIVMLFIIALIFALFSLTMTVYVQTQRSTGNTFQGDLGGNVGLEVLPGENVISANNVP